MPTDLQSSGDTSLAQIVQAIVTVLAVINPVVCGSIFLTLTSKLELAQRRRAAARVALSILVILVASALIGLKVLSLFNISLEVFRVVGGMICKRRSKNPSLEATEWFGCAGVKIRQAGSLCLIRARARDEGRGTVREGTTCGSD